MADQDGATGTVDKARFDGLMSSFNREKARADALERQLQGVQGSGQSDSQGQATGDSQTGESYEEGGLYEYSDGELKPFEPPTPGRHNEARRQQGDDGSAAWLKREVRSQAVKGNPTGGDPWPA